MKTSNPDNCCKSDDENNEAKGLKQGIIYGLIPHAGCLAFLLFSVIGVTTATAFFRPLLMSKYLFYGLIGISILFATISAIIYLKRHYMLSLEGVKKKWQYLSVLFGTTIFINVFLFMVVFPYAVNASLTSTESGAASTTIQVDIPCTGHAPLIKEDVMALNGVKTVQFKAPDTFVITYDPLQISENDILNIEIFQTYDAKVLS